MSNPRKIIIKSVIACILLITGLFGLSCRNADSVNANSNNSVQTNTNSANNPAKDDVSELLTIIRLPEVPEEVVWREEPLGKTNDRVPGPTDRKLVAVLKYDAETAAKLVAQIEKSKQPEQAEIGAENWFPEELIAQSQVSGNEMLKGTTYGANDFFNMPYGNGKITRVENTNYFVLELYTS
jgi:hypothetical protein